MDWHWSVIGRYNVHQTNIMIGICDLKQELVFLVVMSVI